MPFTRRCCLRLVLALGVCLCVGSGAGAQERTADEREVKASFLFNFLKFSSWPSEVLRPGASIDVCVFGDTAVATSLERLHGQAIDGHVLAVRLVVDPADLRFCHVIFVGESESQRTRQALSAIGDAAVLTVGEQRDFLERGGIINFVSEDNRIRFDINQAAAERANVRISAHLLRLARRTVGRRS